MRPLGTVFVDLAFMRRLAAAAFRPMAGWAAALAIGLAPSAFAQAQACAAFQSAWVPPAGSPLRVRLERLNTTKERFDAVLSFLASHPETDNRVRAEIWLALAPVVFADRHGWVAHRFDAPNAICFQGDDEENKVVCFADDGRVFRASRKMSFGDYGPLHPPGPEDLSDVRFIP